MTYAPRCSALAIALKLTRLFNDMDMRSVANLESSAEHDRSPRPSPAVENFIRQAVQSYLAGFGSQQPTDLYAFVLKNIEQPLLNEVAAFTRGNQSKMAQVLGISRTTLRKMLKAHGMAR
jgi:Fis family transcriptional regulator, factor for inversion stimulation protein